MKRPKKWLPEHVTEYTDRHGKRRYRYRRKGFPVHHFRHAPGSLEFAVELAACTTAPQPQAGSDRIIPGTLNDLIARYYASPRWVNMKANSQATYRGIIERYRAQHGDKPVALATTGALDRHIAKLKDTPAAANNLRKVLKRLFSYAVKIGMRRDNPADHTDGFKAGPGWHTWTEDEIDAFRARHPIGTKARLAMELLLNTAARRCNVVNIGRADLKAGKFRIPHAKGNNAATIRALPETLAAIEAMPVVGIGPYLVTEFGKPFSPAGFGNWFRDRCDEAGLPQCSAHGLRKAMSRRLAEADATDAQGQAVTGHKRDRTFAHYREEANREALADTAMANLETRQMANLRESDGNA